MILFRKAVLLLGDSAQLGLLFSQLRAWTCRGAVMSAALVPLGWYPLPLTGLLWSAAGTSLWSAQGCKCGFILHKAAPAPEHGPLIIWSVSSK